MSLIDEALKRARMEAAQRAAESEGLPYPAIPRHLAPPRRRRWLAPLLLAVAVLGGVVAGALLATRGRPKAEVVTVRGGARPAAPEPAASGPETLARDPLAAPSSAAPVDSAPALAPPSGQAGAPPAAEESRTAKPAEERPAAPPPEPRPAAGAVPSAPPRPADLAPEPEPPAAPRTPSPTPPAPTSQPAPRSAAPAAPPAAALPAPETEAAPPPLAAATSAVADPDSGVLLVLPDRPAAPEETPAGEPPPGAAESRVRRLQLPDGSVIELGGIAWSETGPFALIDGRVVGPGAAIGPFTLEGIGPGHVMLVGEGRRIHLSLQ